MYMGGRGVQLLPVTTHFVLCMTLVLDIRTPPWFPESHLPNLAWEPVQGGNFKLWKMNVVLADAKRKVFNHVRPRALLQNSYVRVISSTAEKADR